MKIIDVACRALDDLSRDQLRISLRSATTIVASPDDPAPAIARKIDQKLGDIVVVVDSDDTPIGMLVPNQVKEALKVNKGIEAESLEDALRNFGQDPEEQGRGFQHEWLNGRPQVLWCDVHRHYTTPPCPYL